MSFRVAATLLAVLVLAACGGGRPDGGALIATLEPAPGAHEVSLLVATTREAKPGTAEMYSGERSGEIGFATVTVSLPPGHQAGQIEWPRRAPGDPSKDFVTREAAYLDGTSFRDRLRAAVAARPKGSRTVGIFVHGYNTDFDEGVYRAAQVVHDTGFEGVPVVFTWASRGELVDYVYDRDSATVARDGLEETLRTAAASGAESVLLFAHSMGNWVAVEALRQAKIAGDGDFGGKLDTVILAAPDIDVDVFKAQMKRLGVPKRPFIMFASSDDRALAISSLISGDKPRLGAYTADAGEIADLGVVVVDLSEVEGPDSMNHAKFAALAPDFAKRLRERLAAGDALAVERTGLTMQASALGSSIGGLIGTTAGVAITLPAVLITAPFQALGRR
jgi:esterase/lipase superfamily enzyme